MPQDFLGQELAVGDVVVITQQNYRNFQKGIILSFTSRTAQIKIDRKERSWYNTIKQFHEQMIKVTDPRIVFEVNRDLN